MITPTLARRPPAPLAYLTCEENFNWYFQLDAGAYDPEQQLRLVFQLSA